MTSIRFQPWLPASIACVLICAALSSGQQPLDLSVDGGFSDAYFGFDVAGGTDVDRDGFDDFVIGSSEGDTAEVFSGADLQRVHLLMGESVGDHFGVSVALPGDVNGDGFADIFVGAEFHSSVAGNAGRCYLYSGATGNLIRSFDGPSQGARLGYSVAGAGDVDGDGVVDLLAGAPYTDIGGAFDVGSFFVYSGATGAQLMRVDGESDSDLFGSAVDSIGDLDGDGRSEVIAGARWNNDAGPNAGKVYIWAMGETQARAVFFGESGGDQFGAALASVDDQDGDGLRDLAIGAFQNDFGMVPNPGRAYIYSSGSQNQLQVWTGSQPQARLGYAVADAGDVNGDGQGDVVVSALFHNSLSGRVNVYSGVDGSLLYQIDGEANLDLLGISVAGGGDANGDGFAEILAAAPLADVPGGSADVGRAYLVSDPSLPVGPFLGPCARGSVGRFAGGPYNVLTIDNESGGDLRRVDRNLGDPFFLRLAQPPMNAFPSHFMLFGMRGVPGPSDQFQLFSPLYAMCFAPSIVAPTNSNLFLLASSFGGGVVTAGPTPLNIPVFTGIPIPIDLSFQALMQEDPLTLRPSNALVLSVR